jgi:hypothetical protein
MARRSLRSTPYCLSVPLLDIIPNEISIPIIMSPLPEGRYGRVIFSWFHCSSGTGKRNHLSLANLFRTRILLVASVFFLMARQTTAMEFPIFQGSPTLSINENRVGPLDSFGSEHAGFDGSPRGTTGVRSNSSSGEFQNFVGSNSSITIVPPHLPYLYRDRFVVRPQVENIPDGDSGTLWALFESISLLNLFRGIHGSAIIIYTTMLGKLKSFTRIRESAGHLLSCRLGGTA